MDHKISALPNYRIEKEENKVIIRFFCQLSGAAVYGSGPIDAEASEETVKKIWKEEGERSFNRCKKCGKWVCDLMYNPDVFQCVECAPWEAEPNFCVSCGVRIPGPDTYCRSCGQRLRYKEVWP